MTPVSLIARLCLDRRQCVGLGELNTCIAFKATASIHYIRPLEVAEVSENDTVLVQQGAH